MIGHRRCRRPHATLRKVVKLGSRPSNFPCRLCPGMHQELTDHREAFAEGQPAGGKAKAEIIKVDWLRTAARHPDRGRCCHRCEQLRPSRCLGPDVRTGRLSGLVYGGEGRRQHRRGHFRRQRAGYGAGGRVRKENERDAKVADEDDLAAHGRGAEGREGHCVLGPRVLRVRDV